MILKYTKIIFISFFALHIIYLAIVWIWANAAVELIDDARSKTQKISLLPQQQEILIKIEDPKFYDHFGLNISNGQGLTTLTSALARDIFLYRKKLDGVKGMIQSFYRWVFDCCKKIDIGRDIMALTLDRHVTKHDQLELILNMTYFGQKDRKGVIGFKNAAMAYYEKPLEDLSEHEFAGLVAMIKAPNYYHPINNPEIHALRVARIERIVDGDCSPDGYLDLTYEHC